jgi:hypothetical protein
VFGVIVPVGPGAQEIARLADTLDSLRTFEGSEETHLILIDDNAQARDLSEIAATWKSREIIRTALWRDATPDPYSAMVAGTFEGLRAAAGKRLEFVLKLDTDALVIGPVADKLRAVFADERIGLAGSYTHTCTGARRDWSGWKRQLRRATQPVAIGPGRSVRYRSVRACRSVRALLRQATDNGYTPGEHCLGGAYAVGPRLLEQDALFAWRPWVGTHVSEDVVVGLLVIASGLTIRGLVGEGEAFGLAWKNLPLPPEELIQRGYSIAHSVRDQAYGEEAALRAYFRRHRTPACANAVDPRGEPRQPALPATNAVKGS